MCGAQFLARRADVNRGRAIYCGLSCSSKTRPHPKQGGAKNPNWKGGITWSTQGYCYLAIPGHHRAMASGYVKRADVVLEKKLRRELADDEIAHHVNEDKSDDSPGNLEPKTLADHTRLHHPKKEKARRSGSAKRCAWPDDDRLRDMRSRMSLRAIAAVVGCSWHNVWKRMKRIDRGV